MTLSALPDTARRSDAEAARAELETCRRALAALSEADLEGTARATLDAMLAVTGADRGFAVLPREREDGTEWSILARAVARKGSFPEQHPSTAILERALATRAAVRLENALEDEEFRGRPSVLAISVLSVLAVPILAKGRPIAVVYLDSVRIAGIFSASAEAAALRMAESVAPGVLAAVRLAAAREREQKLEARIEALEGGAPAILGRSPKLLAAVERALKAARSDVPILLEGESGTGKELLARAIHAASARARGPFVALNCGAIPEAMLEAELFGATKGAYTGATQDRAGRIEAAAGGTLFLDEIGDMPLALQVKLLRFLQSGEIQKLGEARERHVDVRVVAATHRDLEAHVRDGRFREDLYYRLRVVGVAVPPLRERGEDVLVLAEAFAQEAGRKQGKAIAGLSPQAREALLRHRFRGNVRELENAIRHAVVFATGSRIAAADLPAEIGSSEAPSKAETAAASGEGVPRDAANLKQMKEEAIARLERAFLHGVLERTNGNVSRAARLAGMNRTVLHELMARHGTTAAQFRREPAAGDALLAPGDTGVAAAIDADDDGSDAA